MQVKCVPVGQLVLTHTPRSMSLAAGHSCQQLHLQPSHQGVMGQRFAWQARHAWRYTSTEPHFADLLTV